MKTSKLLINEPPLLISPTLASRVGLNEAILLQQIHYWIQGQGKERNGRRWTYNSYSQWQKQFPFWSTITIRRIIRHLEKAGVLISCVLNKGGTKWYSIDYDKLNAVGEDQNDQGKGDQTEQGVCSKRAGGMVSLSTQVPKTYTETYTEKKEHGASHCVGNSPEVKDHLEEENKASPATHIGDALIYAVSLTPEEGTSKPKKARQRNTKIRELLGEFPQLAPKGYESKYSRMLKQASTNFKHEDEVLEFIRWCVWSWLSLRKKIWKIEKEEVPTLSRILSSGFLEMALPLWYNRRKGGANGNQSSLGVGRSHARVD